mgnify:FL=1
MLCPFDSRSLVHRSPFGAVKAGQNVHFKVLIPRSKNCSGVRLIIREDSQAQAQVYGLFWCGMEGFDYEWWECDFAPSCIGLYWYSFACDTAMGLEEIHRDRGGKGKFGNGEFWQLTAYDPDYQTPSWMAGGILYQVFPDRFAKSGTPHENLPAGRTLREDWGGQPEWRPNGEGKITNSDFFGGDLEGIRQKLPYLQALGVTCLYLNPIFESHSNHRYDTADYSRIDPLLGNEEDFARLCSTAKQYRIRIVLDGVFSHTGSDSVYFNREGRYPPNGAYNTTESPYYLWYKFQKWPDQYQSWWGFTTLPEVTEESSDFLQFVCGKEGIAKKWLRLGASGWRLDVADELPDGFLDEFRRAVKEESEQNFILGEVWEDASNKVSYGARRKFLLGGQLDSVMNYPFRQGILEYLRTRDSGLLMEAVLSICENYPRPALRVLMNHIGTHDTERAITYLAGEPDKGYGREWQAGKRLSEGQRAHGLTLLRLASLLQYTLPGIPCLYYGDEAGMEGYRDPFNRGCYPWGHEDRSLIGWYQKLGALRQSCPCLADGDFVPMACDGPVAAYLRTGKHTSLFTAVNAGDQTRTVSMPQGFVPQVAMHDVEVQGNQLILPPFTGACGQLRHTGQDGSTPSHQV